MPTRTNRSKPITFTDIWSAFDAIPNRSTQKPTWTDEEARLGAEAFRKDIEQS